MQRHDDVRVLNCIRLASTGEGVCYDQGLATFVPGLLPGESGEVKIIERKKNWQRAQLLSLTKSTTDRQEAPCRVFKICGGCQLQHLSYEQTLLWKRRWVEDALQRIGKIQAGVSPVLGMDDPWRYRNKVRLHRDKSGKFGYYQEKSKETVIFPDCLLISEDMNRWLDKLAELLGQDYPEVHSLTLRQNSRGEGLVLIENAKADGLLAERFQVLAEDWFAQGIKEVWGLNSRGVPEQWLSGNAAARAVEELHQDEAAMVSIPDQSEIGFDEHILGLRFKVSPLAFLQVNHKQTEVLYSLVLEWAGLSGKETVWDLYSGIGTVSLALARQAKKVIGVEENPYAMNDARINAEVNGLHNTEFIQGKVEEKIDQFNTELTRPKSSMDSTNIQWGLNPPLNEVSFNQGLFSRTQSALVPDVVVVDPPRAGLHPKVTEKLVELKPGRIIYVSCDPGTLARDLGRLVEGGYSVERVQPVDMFPWTMHVESIVLMTNSGLKGK